LVKGFSLDRPTLFDHRPWPSRQNVEQAARLFQVDI
jgi:hypothetical protein